MLTKDIKKGNVVITIEHNWQNLTRQSSGRRFRIWHFINFKVSRSVSANLLKVVLLNNIVANCAYDES